jgi:hypothetical protein
MTGMSGSNAQNVRKQRYSDVPNVKDYQMNTCVHLVVLRDPE